MSLAPYGAHGFGGHAEGLQPPHVPRWLAGWLAAAAHRPDKHILHPAVFSAGSAEVGPQVSWWRAQRGGGGGGRWWGEGSHRPGHRSYGSHSPPGIIYTYTLLTRSCMAPQHCHASPCLSGLACVLMPYVELRVWIWHWHTHTDPHTAISTHRHRHTPIHNI